jgi:hypothetical protein
MSELFQIKDQLGVLLSAYRMSDGRLHVSTEPGCEKLSVADATRLRDWLTEQLPVTAGDCDETGTEL